MLTAVATVGTQSPMHTSTITDVPGIRVGQVTLDARPTGCTVVLAPPNTVGGVDVRGGAPGTRETDVLAPDNTVQIINAVLLTGGSAFGLDAATGVMKYLDEHHVGFKVGDVTVPIVSGAVLYDLNIGGHPEIRPDAECGYRAAAGASADVAEGSVGAGAGATVGKLAGSDRAMKGGIGTAALSTPDGLIVGAIVATNALGSIVDPRTGQPVAGVRTPDGKALVDPFAFVASGLRTPSSPTPGANTTIGVVATNARLTKAQAQRLAIAAQDGIARAIVPAHTPMDGDTIFVLATGSLPTDANTTVVGALAAQVVSDAILRSVRLATGLPGYPAVRDIK